MSETVRIHPPADLLLEREVAATTLVSGPWSMSLAGAELDEIRYDGVPILRSIRLIVRDENWGTLPMVSDADPGADVKRSATGTQLTLTGYAGEDGGSCAWTLSLRLEGDVLHVHTRVEATTRFLRNRLGLIVLHPPELAGRSLTVEHPDGSVTTTEFPAHISAHQPALDISRLAWRAGQTADDDRTVVDSDIRFTGDVFEMEDQRNWTDASFKTYSTPLSRPFPVALEPGELIEQSIELRCSRSDRGRVYGRGRDPGVEGALTSARMRFGPADAAVPLPVVTTSVSSGPVSGPQIPSGRGPLLCELDPGQPNWRFILDRAVAESGGRPLDLRLIIERDDEADVVLGRLLSAGITTARIGVFDRVTHVSELRLLTGLQQRLRDRGMAPEIVGGTRAHFTELNRNQSRLEGWDGPLTFSITPFMHDRSGHQLVESIAMQRLVARDALAIANGRPLHIGPITLGARFNAVATSAPVRLDSDSIDDGYGAEHVDGATDIRQQAPSIGAWLLASVAALTHSGVASLSYFESFGPRGLIDADGPVSPAAAVLDWVAGLSGGSVAPLICEHPAIVGLAVATPVDTATPSGVTGIVGNLGDAAVAVEIAGIDGFTLEPGAVRRIDLPAS